MDRQARRLARLRQRKASQKSTDQAQYLGFDATQGGHLVQDEKGNTRIADPLTLGAVALNQTVQYVGGSFE